MLVACRPASRSALGAHNEGLVAVKTQSACLGVLCRKTPIFGSITAQSTHLFEAPTDRGAPRRKGSLALSLQAIKGILQ
jgi:hypothetical protein